MIRVRRSRNFVMMPNETARRATLSLSAKGLLIVLLSYPDDWEFHFTHIEQQSSNGRDATRTAMNELQEAGYITREQTRNADGTLSSLDYVVSDVPSSADGEPVSGEPASGGAASGEPPTTKNEGTKTDLTKTEPTKINPSSGKPDASEVQEVIDAYNQHRGDLPAARVTNSYRSSKVRSLIRDLGGVREAVAVMGIAASEVAHDPFWQQRRFGLDNLLSQQKAIQKAETAASRGSTNRDDDVADRIRAALHGASDGR